jgi:hypothetical protein
MKWPQCWRGAIRVLQKQTTLLLLVWSRIELNSKLCASFMLCAWKILYLLFWGFEGGKFCSCQILDLQSGVPQMHHTSHAMTWLALLGKLTNSVISSSHTLNSGSEKSTFWTVYLQWYPKPTNP